MGILFGEVGAGVYVHRCRRTNFQLGTRSGTTCRARFFRSRRSLDSAVVSMRLQRHSS
jgi:hypothetical protein